MKLGQNRLRLGLVQLWLQTDLGYLAMLSFYCLFAKYSQVIFLETSHCLFHIQVLNCFACRLQINFVSALWARHHDWSRLKHLV